MWVCSVCKLPVIVGSHSKLFLSSAEIIFFACELRESETDSCKTSLARHVDVRARILSVIPRPALGPARLWQFLSPESLLPSAHSDLATIP